MKVCRDCQKVIPYGICYGDVCPSCRGKRSALINKQKVAKHGPAYFDRKSKEAKDARR